ncbi:MAG: chemotaxis protein CheA [Gammaproteobacteria bacterium]|nr:chemotaxis protein CheA [Gammaproteobacteria bacterium]
MTIDLNDEILQDFLVEADEILEQLGEQLIDLERQPDDFDLLNAVFRGFHTVKGGAGFLNLGALVAVCHRAEDVFNLLRQGQLVVDAHLMDTVLQVLDVVNDMFDNLRSGIDPEPAEPELIQQLQDLANQKGKPADGAAPPVHSQPEVEPPPAPKSEEVVDPEPEIVDEEKAVDSGSSEDITEEEFEALLDELHGEGKHGGGIPADASETTADDAEAIATKQESKPTEVCAVPARPDDITEEEFEALLDKLHGSGQFGQLEDALQSPSISTVQPDNKAVASPSSAGSSKTTSSAPAGSQPASEPKAAPRAKQAKDVSKGSPKAETTVRVDTARLDQIMNMVGELVLVRNRLANLKDKLDDEDVASAFSHLDVVTADLQNSVMKTRMQPVKKVFGRFPRLVRDLARGLNREVELEMHGEDTDLDKNLVEALSDPMVHLVRNAVDHGIESPEDREKAGKERKGRVILSAAQEGDHILLSISDDGKGMDPEVLRRKAIEKGLMDEEAAFRLENRECYNLIFHPGFSTKSEISDVSGRGVGMDVVKTRISQMNGHVEIDSEKGKGSTILIKLPLTLAILPTLMVIIGEQPFAFPLASVVEIFNLDLGQTNRVDGQLTIMVRERALPLFYLSKWLIHGKEVIANGHLGHVVVVNVGGRQVGFVVDSLIGQEEVVIKPLGAVLQGLDGMAGATITGNGRIALILDIPGLMRRYARRY